MTSFSIKVESKTFTINIDDEYAKQLIEHLQQDDIAMDGSSNKNSKILDKYIKVLTEQIHYKQELDKLREKLSNIDDLY